MGRKIILLFLFLILASCNSRENELVNKIEDNNLPPKEIVAGQEFFDAYHDEAKLNSLKLRIYEGDTLAFKALHVIYTLSGHDKEFLCYAMVMANNYSYAPAYYQVYFNLYSKNTSDKTRRIAVYNLLKAKELGYKQAEYELEETFKGQQFPSAAEYFENLK